MECLFSQTSGFLETQTSGRVQAGDRLSRQVTMFVFSAALLFTHAFQVDWKVLQVKVLRSPLGPWSWKLWGRAPGSRQSGFLLVLLRGWLEQYFVGSLRSSFVWSSINPFWKICREKTICNTSSKKTRWCGGGHWLGLEAWIKVAGGSHSDLPWWNGT